MLCTLTGPFTGVKEQVLGTYAARLADAGLVALAFDHRGFGESGGRRQHEDPQGKLADLRAAVGVLAGRAEVDSGRIALVGVCLGGGTPCAPRRQTAGCGRSPESPGTYNSPARFAAGMGVDRYRAALTGFLDRYDEYLPAVAPDGGDAAMPGEEPYAYYGTERSASPYWRNEVTRGSLHSLMTFDALGAADLLGTTPLLVVHGKEDAYCSPDLARELYERTPGDKQIRWLDTTVHIDLYDQEPYLTEAAESTVDFLRRYL